MTTNPIQAILNIINSSSSTVEEDNESVVLNRANEQGKSLETFVKDAFSNSFDVSATQTQSNYARDFSYLGNSNNPPDLMIKNGDAIEVKKLESLNTIIQLNSSPPKNKLFSNDPRISSACKNAEVWEEKDILYCIGYIKNRKTLRSIWMVYGDCYAADKDIYSRLSSQVTQAISHSGLESHETKEIANFPEVDPMGITTLRVRGMWTIQNPNIVFKDISSISSKEKEGFDIRCLMKVEKYNSMPIADRHRIQELAKLSKNLTISNHKTPFPDNPAQLLDVVLISYRID